MGHLLSTVNPEAAAEADMGRLVPHHGSGGSDTLALLPRVGQMVSYHPRPGEFRRGRSEFPAIVLHSDEERGTLDLLVVYDRDDWHGIDAVPPWPHDGSTLGWTRVESPRTDSARDPRVQGLIEQIEVLEGMVVALTERIFGKLEMPAGETLLGIVDEHEDRLIKIERTARHGDNKAKPKAAAKPSQE